MRARRPAWPIPTDAPAPARRGGSRKAGWRLAAAVCALSLALAPAAADMRPSVKKPSHRALRESMFDLTRMLPVRIVMLGDSLTEQAPWSEITGCPFVVNRGIGGDDSAGVAQRTGEIVKLEPRAVFLMIGVNDATSGVPTARIVANARETIEKLKSAGAHVYLLLVLPVAKSFSHQVNGEIDALNAAYLDLARETGAATIDFRKDVRTEDGYLRDEMTLDGIHLTPAGFRVWRDAIAPAVRRECRVSAPDLARAGLIEGAGQ